MFMGNEITMSSAYIIAIFYIINWKIIYENK